MMHRWMKVAALAAMSAGIAACEARDAAPANDTNAAANSAGVDAGPPQAPLAMTAADPSLQWGPCPDVFPAGCELTVLRGDPAKPNADVFLRVPGGYAIPAHSHSSAERMVLVSGRLQVKYQGNAEAALEPGSYAYGPANLPHRATCAAGDPCTLFIAFEGPVDVEAFSGTI